MDIYDLADMLEEEITESGKTRWSAKDVKDFFLSENINLSLDEILQVWNACSSDLLLGCDQVIEASSDSESITSGFKFDFIVVYNYSEDIWNTVLAILTDVFETNGCEVIGYSLDEVDYSDVPEYREFDVIQAGVDFSWEVEYDADKIETQIHNKMQDNGYEVIGNPDFYSID